MEKSEADIRKALRNFRQFMDMEFKERDVDIRKLGDALSDLEWSIIRFGKWILKRKYNRLDVSLKKPFVILTVIASVFLVLGLDYLFGFKIFGLYGATISLVVAIFIYLSIGLAVQSQCKECNSYFSLNEKPLKTSDVKYVSPYISDNDVKRIECEVCGRFNYGYRPKLRKRE